MISKNTLQSKIKAAKDYIKKILWQYDDILYKLWLIFMYRNASASMENTSYKISIIVPTYNTDINYLSTMIDSVKDQIYQNWELILVDDASPNASVRNLIKKYAKDEPRIKYKFLSQNRHISGATNAGIKLSTGDFIALLDHDDLIYPNTLNEVIKVILNNKGVKFIYTDEDKIIGKRRTQPFFKPSWNLALLYNVNYITHFAVIKKEVLDLYGYEDGSYNGAQDWELFLRIGRNLSKEEIIHIPKILYSWRMHEKSTSVSLDAKPYVLEAQINAVRDDIKARGIEGIQVKRSAEYPGQLVVNYGRTERGLNVKDIYQMIGLPRMLYILFSSRLSLSKHIYRTTSYDKIK